MKKRIIILAVMMSMALMSCDKEEVTEPVVGCECEWVETKYHWVDHGGPVPSYTAYFITTPSDITNCDLDGIITSKGVLICK